MVAAKKASLISAIALSVTGMIGSGWLFSAQLNAKAAGNYSFLAWILAALLALAVGICLAQVVVTYPVRGANSRVGSLSHNHIFGMPFAFAAWFGLMAMVATEAQATTQYLAAALPHLGLMSDSSLSLTGKLLALAILLVYLVINYYGIIVLTNINNVVTALKIFVPFFTIIVFLLTHFDTSNFKLATNETYSLSAVTAAMVNAGLVYSYNGFQISVSFASEIKNPQRNIPLALIISIGSVMVFYLLLQTAFMGAVPHEYLLSGWQNLNLHSPLVNIAMLLGANFLAAILIADSIVSPSGTGFSYLGSTARMFYAMAVEGQMPKWAITKLHPRYNLCRRSLMINWVLASIVLWNSESWASLMVIVTGYNLIGYMAAPISMGAVKPALKPFGMLVFLALSLVMATIPQHDLWVMNLSILAIVLVFSVLQIKNGAKFSPLVSTLLPFLGYLWLLQVCQEHTAVVLILAAFFYLIMVNPRFIDFCHQQRNSQPYLDEEQVLETPSK